MDDAEWKQYSEAEQTQLTELALWDKVISRSVDR